MKRYSDTRDAMFQELYEIALADEDVIVLTCDTGALMFNEFAKNMPARFYNVGVTEQNAMSAAAGLAFAGKRVFVFGITNFVTLRCYEQIRVDICCMGHPVTILGMGTGYVYSEDGPTHHMTEDITIMRALPKMTIWSPSDYTLTAAAVHLAYEDGGPCYIRFDKGPFDPLYDPETFNFQDGLSVLKTGSDIMIVATGIMVGQALKAAHELGRAGLDAGVIDLYRLKPVNKDMLIDAVRGSRRIVTLEEHTVHGGLGGLVCEVLAERDVTVPVKIFGIPDLYRCQVGRRDMLRALDKIDISFVIQAIEAWAR